MIWKGGPPSGEGRGVQQLPGAAGWDPFSLHSHLTPMTQAWPCPWRALGQCELIATARSRSGKQVHPRPPTPERKQRVTWGPLRQLNSSLLHNAGACHGCPRAGGMCAGLLPAGDTHRHMLPFTHTHGGAHGQPFQGPTLPGSWGPFYPIRDVQGQQPNAHEAGSEDWGSPWNNPWFDLLDPRLPGRQTSRLRPMCYGVPYSFWDPRDATENYSWPT